VTPAITNPDLLHIAVAALGGAAIGLEREWSGHAAGPDARFAGVRTFTMLGGISGVIGWLWLVGVQLIAVVLLAGLMALIVAAYARASARTADGTTEVAAIVTSGAGVLAGLGLLGLASGIIATAALLLVEKSRLHGWVAHVDEPELRAGFRFAVMAVVILPLLPVGPFGPGPGVRPRELWTLVLFFSGLSFVGYLARRAVGEEQGYSIAGLLGGIVSSTNVTLNFSRASRDPAAPAAALAAGVLAACAVLFVRLLIATAVLSPPLSIRLLPLFVPAFIVGVAAVVWGWRRRGREEAQPQGPANPLELWAAVQMAVLFQLVLFLTSFMNARFGTSGVLITGAIVGLTDMDALTLSMSRQVAAGGSVDLAAMAVSVGVLSNTALKTVIAVVIGRGRFPQIVLTGLSMMAGVLAALMWILLR
jgi:uncharacterized membrane protein (DUF4010 family)